MSADNEVALSYCLEAGLVRPSSIFKRANKFALSRTTQTKYWAMILRFVGSAKGNACIASGAYKLAIRRHGLNIGDCLANRNGDDITSLERHHRSAFSIHQGPHGTRSVIRCQHPIESVGSATALQM